MLYVIREQTADLYTAMCLFVAPGLRFLFLQIIFLSFLSVDKFTVTARATR